MTTRFKFRRVLISGMLVCGFALGAAGCSKDGAISREQDAFVSCWQNADALASGLLSVGTAEDLTRPPRGAPIPSYSARDGSASAKPNSLKDTLDALCGRLEDARVRMSKLPPGDVEKLRREHHDLVERVEQNVDQLTLRHTQRPQLLGGEWDRYRQVLQRTSGRT